MRNPSRGKIIEALDTLLGNLNENDQLVIYYSGHGYFDEALNQGYWMPSDAYGGKRGSWLSNGDIRDYLYAIKAHHILLVSDACFSGSIFENYKSFDENKKKAINNLLNRKSQMAMTGGVLEPVPDKSIFNEYLIKAFVKNRDPFVKAGDIFREIQDRVLANTDNSPQFGVVKNTKHEGGQFIFRRK